MNEEWRPCVGFEGFYEVSNFGRVRSIAVYIDKHKRVYQRKAPVLKAIETNRDGYKRVLLCHYGKHHHCAVHRLVAMAFIPNEKNLEEVNHKDENPANNNVENLEWCSRKYNANYGTLPKRISKRMSVQHPTAKRVYQLDINGNVIAEFKSQREAGRIMGIGGEVITRACKGTVKLAGGYRWKYAL